MLSDEIKNKIQLHKMIKKIKIKTIKRIKIKSKKKIKLKDNL